MFNKEWFLTHQKRLKWFANTKYGKDVLGHGLDKVDLILPNGVFKKLDGKIEFEIRTHNKYSKRLFYSYKPIWKAFHWFDVNIANSLVPQLNLGFDSFGDFFPDAGTGNTTIDGRVGRDNVDQTLADIRGGAGTTAVATDTNTRFVRISSFGSPASQFDNLIRAFFLFDTSTLGAGSTIDTAILSLYGTNKQTDLGSTTCDIVVSTPANDNALITADYAQTGTTVFADKSSAAYSTSAYNNFTLDSNGEDNINVTGISKFGARLGWDTDNSFGGSWVLDKNTSFYCDMADKAGTSTDPKLAGTFTPVPSGGNPMFFSSGGLTLG